MARTSASVRRRRAASRRRNKLLYHIMVLFGIGLIFILFTGFVHPFTSAQLWMTDQLFVSRTPSPNIVIIGIDDATLQTYGKWSDWSRDLHAEAIDNLAAAGAKVIGFDVLFTDVSSHDEAMAEAIANAGNVVLPVAGSQVLSPVDNIVTYDYFLLPVADFLEASQPSGHANIVPDSDGKVRRIPVIAQDSAGDIYPAFSVAMLHALFNMPLPDEYVQEDGNLYMLARNVPVDEEYQLRLNFSADSQSLPYLSYGDVISGSFDPSVVDNKIVVIGMTATGELDTWPIPTSSVKVPGVYIHAAAMDTILRTQFLTEVSNLTTILIMLLMLVIVGLAIPFLGLKWGSAITAGLFVIYILVSFFSFDRGHVLNMLYPLTLLPVLYVSSIVTTVVNEQSDKRMVKDLFGRYVSPQVANQILNMADTGALELGGERREVTILFADIRQFTSMSEKMDPEDIVHMLNTYLSVMIERVLDNGGMVNKFAGDNIMAVWNAPQAQKEHARLAAKAAWDSQKAISEMQEKDDSLPRVQFGIGINTGDVLAGNIGSSGRSEYTVIGDAVNLASRICSAAPGTQVWLGPKTYEQVKEFIKADKLEPQAFKGKAEKIVVYRLTGWKKEE